MRALAPLTSAVVLACLTAAPAADAATLRLARGDREVTALTVSRATPVALLDDGTLVRGTHHVGRVAATEYPMLAADARGRVVAAWDDPISGGVRYTARAVPSGPTVEVTTGTGPGRLAVAADGSIALACPDVDGDIAVTTFPDVARPRVGQPDPYALPETRKLTHDAPARRHFAAGIALRKAGPLVLDLVQRRRHSTLQVVGAGAPRGALTSVGRLRQIEGAIAATEDRVAVVYVTRGRPMLATAAPAGRWRRRALGGYGVEGAPGVAFSGGRIVAAWAQQGEIYSATVGAHVRRRRLTRTAAEDRDPLVAAGPTGRAFVAWTSRAGSRHTPLSRRIG